jgi:cell division protein FtsB
MLKTLFRYLQLSFNYLWLIAAATYLAVSASQAVVRNYQSQQITLELKQKLAVASLEKQKLEALIVYYKTDAFKEKELRRALLLAKPNEKVYALPESYNPKNLDQLTVAKSSVPKVKAEIAQTNVEQWVAYLFN